MRRRPSRRRWLFLASAAAFAGCSHASPVGPVGRVDRLVAERIGARVVWRSGCASDLAVDERLRAILARGPTKEQAVQIALLRNPEVQVAYEDLGVAQADLVQAGLLANPILSLAVMPPISGTGTKIEYGVAFDFLDLLRRPARVCAASARRDAAVLATTRAVLDLAHEVEIAWIERQALEEGLTSRRAAVGALEAAADWTRRSADAGNATEVAVAEAETEWLEARADLARREGDLRVAQQTLARLMGVQGPEPWGAGEGVRDLPDLVPSAEDLERRALVERLELQALRAEQAAIVAEVGLAGIPGEVHLGAAGEKEADGDHVLGPSAEVGIPILDTGSGRRLRAQALLRRTAALASAKRAEVREEVRSAVERYRAARESERAWREDLLPRRRRVTELAQAEFNAMQVGVVALLVAKRRELDAAVEWAQAKRDGWIALADLAHAVGGRIELAAPPPAPAPVAPSPPAVPAPAHEHGGH